MNQGLRAGVSLSRCLDMNASDGIAVDDHTRTVLCLTGITSTSELDLEVDQPVRDEQGERIVKSGIA